MTWTTDTPTREGWYWWKRSIRTMIVEWDGYHFWYGNVRVEQSEISGEFYGPLEPPPEYEERESQP